jgi:hypothetical protein
MHPGRNSRLVHVARLDARYGVESGAVLPDGLGALGPTLSDWRALGTSQGVGPSIRLITHAMRRETRPRKLVRSFRLRLKCPG